MKETVREKIILGLSLLLGALFLWAAAGKLIDLPSFSVIVSDYQLLPKSLAKPVAWLVAFLELACGVALVGRWKLRYASLAALSLLLVFTAAVASAMVRGLHIECGCFSIPFVGPIKTEGAALARNGVLVGLVLLLICLVRKRNLIDS